MTIEQNIMKLILREYHIKDIISLPKKVRNSLFLRSIIDTKYKYIRDSESFTDSFNIYKEEDQFITCLAPLLEINKFALANTKGQIKILNNRFEFTKVILAHFTSINCLLVSTNGKLVTAANDNTIKVFNIYDDFKCTQKLNLNRDNIKHMKQISHSNLITISFEGTVSVWDLKDSITLHHKIPNTNSIYTVVDLNERNLAFYKQHLLIIWSIEKKAALQSSSAHSGGFSALARLDCGQIISAGGKSLKLWDWIEEKNDLSCSVVKNFAHNANISLVTETKKGCILSVGLDSIVKFWNKNFDCVKELDLHVPINHIQFLKNRKIAFAFKNYSLIIVNEENFDKELTVYNIVDKIIIELKEGWIATVESKKLNLVL
jgi:WD40 repeat protein